MNLINEAKQMKEQLIKWREDLHQMPELGLQCFNTTKYISHVLDEIGIKYDVIVDGSGIIASMGQGEKCLLLRADMDALPMKEEANVDYKSNNGNMHACGHDLHATSLLGAAYLLKKHENELNATIKLLFQPGEEVFLGARKCIEDGILDNPKVDHAFALHVNSKSPINTFSCGLSPMSSVYGFEIEIQGVGGHGSVPDTCIDPINTGVHIYLALQELIAREVSASEKAVCTIGAFNGGSVGNIIPDKVTLKGTLRTFNSEVEEYLIKRIHEVINSVCNTYRCTYKLTIPGQCKGVICDEKMMNDVLTSFNQLNLNIIEDDGNDLEIASKAFKDPNHFYVSRKFEAMASEDFAFISHKVPSVYASLGAAVDKKETYGMHHPLVEFNHDALINGSAIYAIIALNYNK